MQTSLEARHRTLKLACLTALVLLAQGCATTPTVYRGVTPQAAAEYVAKVVGTAEPSGTTLARYYQEEETYRSWSGTWNCNGKLITVTLNNLVITPGPGNSVETAVTFDGSCNGASTTPWIRVGRYNNSYLLLYDPSAPTTFIYEYAITKDPYRVAPKLTFRGSTQYIDEVWGLLPARKHLSPVTGNKIAESGGPADIYETSGYVAQTNDPRPTAKEDRMAIERNESRSLHETARGIDDRRNERIRDDKAADRAALVSGINQMARDNADAQAQRDAAMVRAAIPADAQRAGEATRVVNERAAQVRPPASTRTSTGALPVRNPPSNQAAERPPSALDLSGMKNDFQLYAIKCLGTYYVTGNVPSVKGLSCYNLAYEAICPKGQTVTGEAKNLRAGKSSSCANMEFVYQLYPTPSCSVIELDVKVTDVQPGCK